MSKSGPEATNSKDVAFYYPNPIWNDAGWLKNLLLFFDGVTVLVPDYMRERFDSWDPSITTGLRDHGLLHFVEPESAVDKNATAELATALTDVIVSGVLDQLAHEGPLTFRALSMSRLGYGGDRGLAEMVVEELKSRNLARDSEDGLSIPMHPLVRSLILTMLAQILRPSGAGEYALHPATDRPEVVASLVELLRIKHAPTNADIRAPSSADVVAFDLREVGVDVSSFPLDEVLAYRAENRDAYRAYQRSLRLFLHELSGMTDAVKQDAIEERKVKLDAMATALAETGRVAWTKKSKSILLGLSGAVWTFATGDPIGALIAASMAAFGDSASTGSKVDAYSYLIGARSRFG